VGRPWKLTGSELRRQPSAAAAARMRMRMMGASNSPSLLRFDAAITDISAAPLYTSSFHQFMVAYTKETNLTKQTEKN